VIGNEAVADPGRGWRWRPSARVTDHLIQGVLIFASVFLAFWLNDYRLQVGERRATAAAMEAVVAEVAANRAILERWAPYHLEISRALEGRLQAGLEGQGRREGFDPHAYMDDRGIFQEILTYDSWDYLRQADVRLGIDTRLAVNRIFRQQEYVDRGVREVVSFLNERALFDPGRAGENLVMFYRLITDLYFQEVAMIQSYDRFLERHSGGAGGTP
jgi:hypothetical protein